jgi:hypothetical protein
MSGESLVSVEDEARRAADAEELITRHGLEELSGMQVEAHGSVFTVSQALAECPPFAKMVTGLAASLEAVPGGEDVLKATIRNMAAKTEVLEAPDAKKKLK